jgi:hypothetical protein
MTIFRVNYNRTNFGRFFSGSNDYTDNTNKYFTTREKAEGFVNAEETEFVPTWGRNEVVKPAGVGKIFEEVVE